MVLNVRWQIKPKTYSYELSINDTSKPKKQIYKKWSATIHIIKKNTEAWVVARKEIGLEVSADKTKYMVMSWDQNVGRNYNIKIDSSSFKRVEQFI